MEQTSHFNWTWLVITLVTIPVVECNAKAPDPIYQAPPESPNPGECWRDGDVASEADMERMFLWAIDNGANVSLVEYIQDDYGGWELVAKTDVPENETLFEIPVGIAMHGDNVTDHPIIGKIFAQAKKVIPNFDSPSAGALGGIVMLLHYEMFYNYNHSFWKPFLATFPRTFPMPFYFQGKDAEILHALDQTGDYQKAINGHVFFVNAILQYVVSTRPDLYGNLSDHIVVQRLKRELSWAASTVFSRVHGPRFDGDKSALIPVAILMNHDTNSDALGATVRDTEEAEIQMEGAHIKLVSFIHTEKMFLRKGDPILTSYSGDGHGKDFKTDKHLLNTYGFITGEESRQCLPIKVKMRESMGGLIIEEIKAQMLRRLGLMENSEENFQFCLSDQVISFSLLQVLRLMHVEVEDLHNGASIKGGEFLRIYNEHKALSLITNVINEITDLAEMHRKEAEALLDGQSPNLNQKRLFDIHEGMVLAAKHTYGLVEKYWVSFLQKHE